MKSKPPIVNNDRSGNPLLDCESQLREDEPGLRRKSALSIEDGPVTSCGIGSWRPTWLQYFASPKFFMLNMALVGIIQSMTGTLFFSSISTFERRYAFDSKISGVILIADNFAEMILNPIVGYLGVRYNRAKLIAGGEVILAFSCFLTAMPYAIYGPGTHLLSDQTLLSKANTTNFEMCSTADGAAFDCASGRGATVWTAVFFLILGSFARGLGYTCYFVIGFPYLDDNLPKSKSPIYISIMQSIRLIGPASGFMLSAFCLSFYEDPWYDPGISNRDPAWIGAWWASFALTGSLLLIAALPMFFFPMEFKGASVKTKEIQKKIKEGGGSVGAMKRFVTNPVVMLCLFGNIFRYVGTGGYIMFKSKYIESQYRQSSSSASFLTGAASFMPMGIGIVLGGVVLSYFKPRPKMIFIMVFIVELVYPLAVSSGLFLGCDPLKIDGHYDPMGHFSLRSSCSGACKCSTRVYTPVCSSDQATTYFSPCHAGCSSYNSQHSTFEGCTCFSGSATKGYCPSDVTNCQTLAKYITIVTVGSIISSVAKTPNTLIALRNVPEMDKGFAIGVASTLMDIFAFIPYPLLFGYIADSACLIWESKCNTTGNCWVYDHDRFRNYLHGTAIAFMILGSCFDFATIFYSGRIKNFYGEEEKREGDDQESADGTELTMVSLTASEDPGRQEKS